MVPSRALIPYSSDVHGSDDLPRYSQTEQLTHTRPGDEKQAISLPLSPRSTLQPADSLGRDASTSLETASLQQGGHDTPPPYLSAYSELRPSANQYSTSRQIPQTLPITKSSYNLSVTFDSALKAYKMQTKQNLTTHPLATQLRTCESPDAVLSLLQTQAGQFGSWRGNEKSKTWFGPVVNVLYTFSTALGEANSTVNIN